MDRLTALLNAPKALRRTAALLLLVAVITAVGGLTWLTVSSLAREAAGVDERRQILGNLHSIISLRKALTDREKTAGETEAGPEFLNGSSEAVIRANLQSRLTEIAATHGVKILSVGNTPIRQRGNLRYAGLRADFSGTNEAVLATLFDIETSKPYLVIRVANIRSTLASQASQKPGPEELVVQIQFYGALPPEGGKQGAGG
ncbi:MAG: type II secretion system protein GspM [Rhizobiaceae bacterium]